MARNLAEAYAAVARGLSAAVTSPAMARFPFAAAAPLAPPLLVSAVGGDGSGAALLTHWRSLGLPDRGVRVCENEATPSVVSIFDSDGELHSAVAGVELVERAIDESYLERFAADVAAAPLLVLDANLSPAALLTVAKMAKAAGVRVWFEVGWSGGALIISCGDLA